MNILDGKVTYLSALGFILAGIGGYLTGEMSVIESFTYVLGGTGLAGGRRALNKVGK